VKVPSDDPARKPANTTGFPDELGDTRGFREVKTPSPLQVREARTGLPEEGPGFQAVAGCVVIQFFAGTLLGRISR
jgi:hypothetical protein